MIQSMTAFGYYTKSLKDILLEIEIRSLNSKFFDFNYKGPSYLYVYEKEIRNVIKKKLFRGKTDLVIKINYNNNYKINHLDKNKFASLFNEIKGLSKNLPNINETTLFNNTLMLNKEFMNSKTEIVGKKIIIDSVKKALNQCVNFRIEEGKSIYKDLKKNIDLIINDLNKIVRVDKKRKSNKKNTILKQISTIQNTKIDKNRIEQELFYFLDKIDINEEIIRLNKHLKLFMKTLNLPNSNGKKLNFICQEIGREINTIGSKCGEFSIQKAVINMKNNLEKIKEEIYNIV
ncbi:MAG: YicC/YloC family endoribonuclease [Bacteroidota bacterium]|nr:YicC/YloC family endoribonuclease [Bacteroidota bacterium]